MSTFPKESLESNQVYDDSLVGDLKQMNKGLERMENALDEYHEKHLEEKYEEKTKPSSDD